METQIIKNLKLEDEDWDSVEAWHHNQPDTNNINYVPRPSVNSNRNKKHVSRDVKKSRNEIAKANRRKNRR